MEPSGAVAPNLPAPSPAVAGARAGGERTPAGRAIRRGSTILLLLGLAVVSDVAGTLIWQEPLSSIWARIQQNTLAGQVARVERSAPTPGETHALARLHTDTQRIALLARALKRTAPVGAGVGRIGIPSLGVTYLLVNGTDTGSLVKGPGIYPQTPFPGAPGTTAVAGHRTTFLAPFRNIDRLRPGQLIHIQMPYGDFNYAMTSSRIVDPTDFSVIRPVGYQQLVLSACDPPFSAAKRIIIFARLVHRAGRGRAFPHAVAAAPLKPTGPGVLILALLAVGVLVVVRRLLDE
ncbi:MAG TPA: class E sortase, partial [Solirubrobacteraceae bacterium]|nr:class E sortase [Solirubrobacteraceae bacterium]